MNASANNPSAAGNDAAEVARLREALRLSEDKFRLLFERAADAILLLDGKSFKFVDCNEATVAMLRARNKQEVCDTHPSRLSPEFQHDGRASFEKANEMIQAVIRQGVHRFVWMHRRMDGEVFPVEVTLTSVQLNQQPLIVTIWRDISERWAMEQSLRESEQKFRLLFAGSAEPMLVLDGESLLFIECNEAALKMMGTTSRDDIVGKSPVDISPEHQPDGTLSAEKAANILRNVAVNRTTRFEWHHRRVDDTEFFVEVVLTSMEIAGLRRVFVTWRDIGERRAMEQALRASEEKFRKLFERSAEPMLVLDADTLLFTECNQAVLDMMGYTSPDQLVNKSPGDISPERQPDGQLSREKALEIVRRVVIENTARFDWVCRRADGTEFFIEVVLTNMEIGRAKRVFVTWRDITDRREAQARMEHMLSLQHATIESTADGILVVNQQGRITTFNQRFAEMWQLPAGVLAAKDDGRAVEWVLGQLQNPDVFVAKVRELYEHPEQESFDLLQFKDGRTFERYSRPQRLAGLTVGRVWSFRDVTERRRAEADIRELNATLERRVEQRTAELRQTQNELEKALAQEKELAALKTNFVSMVSHEFRTPLGVILVSSEVLQRYFDRLQPGQRAEHLDAIVGSVRRMSGMMEDVLLLSRVDAARVAFKPGELNLPALCRRLVDEAHSATHGAAPITFVLAPGTPAIGSGDESLLRHILNNLLSNAVKYSPAGQPVRLSLRRDGTQAVFEITDQGIGISAADQERLFNAFHRGANVGHVSGTGLGLVIVKRCCELHGGTIAVQSREGTGATFTVSLPMFDSD